MAFFRGDVWTVRLDDAGFAVVASTGTAGAGCDNAGRACDLTSPTNPNVWTHTLNVAPADLAPVATSTVPAVMSMTLTEIDAAAAVCPQP